MKLIKCSNIIIGSLFILISLTTVFSGQAFAANGDLEINDQVINSSNKSSKQDKVNTAYDVMPDLFLSGRANTEKKLHKNDQLELKKAEKGMFDQRLTFTLPSMQKTVGKKITFNAVVKPEEKLSKKNYGEGIPKALFIGLIILILILGGLLGVYLGQRFARYFKRSN